MGGSVVSRRSCLTWLAAAVVGLSGLSVAGPALAETKPFTMAVLPDPQYYTTAQWKTDKFYKAQSQWLVDHRAEDNIVFAFWLGDMQQDGWPYEEDGKTPKHFQYNNDGEIEWQRASSAIKILDDANFPYSIVPGNHDYYHWDQKEKPEYYLKYFGPERFKGKPTFGGASPDLHDEFPAGMDTYHLFEAGGYKFLNICLQYAPEAPDLKWAQEVIASHKGVPTILTTHSYLTTTGMEPGRELIFNDFVRKNPQVFMTLNGHVNGTCRMAVANDKGQVVYQMLVDFQDYPEDGGGFMRLMTFDPNHQVIHVKTFSPAQPKGKEWKTDELNQFDLPLDFARRFGPPAEHGSESPAASATVGAPSPAK